MRSRPNCKINLGLHVVRRRADGYHDLESLFLPVPLCDELTIEPAQQFSFKQDGIAIDGPQDGNLVVRAYRLMQKHFGQRVGPVAIKLTKVIPFGAGLGGGSSDAAATICMIDKLFDLNQSYESRCMLARQLGADCPFFVGNTAAYVTGIGDQITPLDSNPIEGLRLVVAMPDDSVSTAEAYRGIVTREVVGCTNYLPLSEAVRHPVEEWRQLVVNDFECTVFSAHPVIRQLKDSFYDDGALYASMSGSGASVFALYPADRHPSATIERHAKTILNKEISPSYFTS